jgi:uncharacterized lipoprotein YajG
MKKILMILVVCFLLAGCGTAARQSEFWDHSSMYQNWNHMCFSWYGHKKVTSEDAKKSQAQGWWGIPISADQTR